MNQNTFGFSRPGSKDLNKLDSSHEKFDQSRLNMRAGKALNGIVLAVLCLAFVLYSLLLYQQKPDPGIRMDTLAAQGKKHWLTYNCNACHQIYGLGGYLGADLTNVYSQKGAAYIMGFLKNGTVIMPDFNLSNQQMHEILAFLKYVDQTGNADPAKIKINPNGTIQP